MSGGGSESGIKFYLWLFCVCMSLAGVQFTYSIQFAIGAPLFVEELKLSNSIASVILATAGPISGFIVQPIIGVISDGCTSKLGRRRPFILGGALGSAAGMAIIGNAVIIGNKLGDVAKGTTPSDHKIALILAIIGLWIMNLCVNIIQGPARAIIADIVPFDKQQVGNSMCAGVMGLSAVIANIVGAQFFGRPEPYRYLFMIGLGFVLLSCIPTLIFAKEVPHVAISGEKTSIGVVFIRIFKGFKEMPSSMLRVTLVYFFSWCAYSPYMIYISTFFGVNVYGGDPITDPVKYEYGLKIAMYALVSFSVVQWAYSVILPSIIKLTNVKFAYFSSQLVATACYILFLKFNHPLWVPILLLTLIAPNFTTFNSIPFALIATATENSKDAGLYMGVMNSAAVVSQTITNSIAGVILKYRGENVAWGIAFGGFISFVACIMVFIIETPKAKEQSDLEKTPLINSEVKSNTVTNVP